jgi:hypothetical protein
MLPNSEFNNYGTFVIIRRGSSNLIIEFEGYKITIIDKILGVTKSRKVKPYMSLEAFLCDFHNFTGMDLPDIQTSPITSTICTTLHRILSEKGFQLTCEEHNRLDIQYLKTDKLGNFKIQVGFRLQKEIGRVIVTMKTSRTETEFKFENSDTSIIIDSIVDEMIKECGTSKRSHKFERYSYSRGSRF